LTLTATRPTIPPGQWTKTRQNKNWLSTSRRPLARKSPHRSRSMFVVRALRWFSLITGLTVPTECIVYTWDYHSSISFWSGLRVQPILSDEVQAFKALIMVHKVLQEGHPVVRHKPPYDLDQILMYFLGRPSKRHRAKRGGLRRAPGPLAMMAAKVPLFSHIRSHAHNLHRIRASYPRICTISVGEASIPSTEA
jgi:hypothetical protein